MQAMIYMVQNMETHAVHGFPCFNVLNPLNSGQKHVSIPFFSRIKA